MGNIMAIYRLTLKSDKKPDGTKVTAAAKVDYIDRKGKYKDLDEKQMANHTVFKNSITAEVQNERTAKSDTMLYDSPFGKIMRAIDGKIKVSKNASVETIAIAMTVAEKVYGGNLILDGSSLFKAETLVAAKEMELPIHFADSKLESKYQSMLEVQKNVRERTNTKFGAGRSGKKSRRLSAVQIHGIESSRGKVSSLGSFRSLSGLSERSVVFHEKEPTMLVPDNELADLRAEGERIRNSVRWDTSRARRRVTRQTADRVLLNIQRSLDSVFASSHIQYINREAAFKQRGGCVYKNHHLPKWAQDDPKIFFGEADKWERANGERYKEIIFALPNELTLDQQKEIIHDFVDHNFKDFYYAFAVHDKIGVMSDGEHQPHVHFVFSTRKLDAIEKTNERLSAKLFFHRGDSKHPEKGGCLKDTYWIDKNRVAALCNIREDYAKIQNKILRKYGIPYQVDHRRNDVQRAEALANGHTLLAKLLNRMPEESIGPDITLRPNIEKVINLKKYRVEKCNYEKVLYAADLLERSIFEEKFKISLNQTTEQLTNLLDSDFYQNITDADKKQLLEKLNEVSALKEIMLWNSGALEKSWQVFMSAEEKESWQNLKALAAEQSHWLIFKDNLKKPESYQTEQLKAYQDLLPELNRTIFELDKKIRKISLEKVKLIFDRFNTPSMKRKINKAREQFLFENEPTKKNLEKANEALRLAGENIREKTDQKNDEAFQAETVYTAKTVLENISISYHELIQEQKHAKAEVEAARKKIITFDRATAMATDKFTKGGYKSLRADLREFKKKTTYLANDKAVFKQKKQAFEQLEKPKFWQVQDIKSAYAKQQADILQTEASLQERKNELFIQKTNLDTEQKRLDNLCATPAGKAKIEAIALGILNKNQPYVKQYNTAADKLTACTDKLNHAKLQLAAVRRQVGKDKGKIFYKIIMPVAKTTSSPSSAKLSNDAYDKNGKHVISHGGGSVGSSGLRSPSTLIADALLGKEKAVQLVARKGNDDKKDWTLMSQAEKDEIANSIANLDRY